MNENDISTSILRADYKSVPRFLNTYLYIIIIIII